MTSLVNSLKKAVSLKEADGASPKASGLLPASPSFSDFSLCTHTDAADEYHGNRLESQPSSVRSSLDVDPPSSSPRWSYMFGTANSAPREIAKGQGSTLKSSTSDVAQSLPRSQEGKIGGMSYYDYCDLIRTSSSL